jgi:hypothetical protein
MMTSKRNGPARSRLRGYIFEFQISKYRRIRRKKINVGDEQWTDELVIIGD